MKPFVKWVGGKRQIIDSILKYRPPHYNRYIEGMVGGGAVLFHQLQNSEIPCIINDINFELINVYNIIKNSVELLINDLKTHQNNPEYFYQIRVLDREPSYQNLSLIKKASRFIYLNRTCYNGLYRVNQKGQFNTPFGKYKNPTICDEINLRNVSNYLQSVQINNQPFQFISQIAEPNDWIYFDPPYFPISSSANFKSYHKDGFSYKDHLNLVKTVKELVAKGCFVMVSNSHCEETLELYKDFNINIVMAKRAINSNGAKRGKIKEILVTTW